MIIIAYVKSLKDYSKQMFIVVSRLDRLTYYIPENYLKNRKNRQNKLQFSYKLS